MLLLVLKDLQKRCIPILFHKEIYDSFAFNMIEVGNFYLIKKPGQCHVVLLALQIEIEEGVEEFFSFGVVQIAFTVFVKPVKKFD